MHRSLRSVDSGCLGREQTRQVCQRLEKPKLLKILRCLRLQCAGAASRRSWTKASGWRMPCSTRRSTTSSCAALSASSRPIRGGCVSPSSSAPLSRFWLCTGYRNLVYQLSSIHEVGCGVKPQVPNVPEKHKTNWHRRYFQQHSSSHFQQYIFEIGLFHHKYTPGNLQQFPPGTIYLEQPTEEQLAKDDEIFKSMVGNKGKKCVLGCTSLCVLFVLLQLSLSRPGSFMAAILCSLKKLAYSPFGHS